MHSVLVSKGSSSRNEGLSRKKCRFVLQCGLIAIAFSMPFVLGSKSVAAWQESRDRVLIERKGFSSRVGIRGRIVDYTGKKITIITMSGSDVQEFPSAEVVSVETPQTEPHINGLIAFSESRYQAAKSEFEKALLEENRTWVRREILAMLVRCALMQGDHTSAGTRFLLLVRSDSATRHYHLIPLVWSQKEINPRLRNSAVVWLKGKREVERLLGASTLLADREYGRRAKTELDSLATCTDLNVRMLARAQLWRIRLGAGKLRKEDLSRWESRIALIPEKLRGGPYYLLGQGYLQRQRYDRAAASFLWLPLVYDTDHFLASRSCLEAAHALFDVGRRAEAVTLYQEVTIRFADTPSAKNAKELLDTITSRKAGESSQN